MDYQLSLGNLHTWMLTILLYNRYSNFINLQFSLNQDFIGIKINKHIQIKWIRNKNIPWFN